MNWKFKAAIFRLLSATQSSADMHYFLQRRVTRNWPRPERNVVALLELAKWVSSAIAQHGQKDVGQSQVLELGAGRDLCVPVALRLMGVGNVVAVDIERLAKLELVNRSAAVLARELGTTIAEFTTWDELRAFGVDYRAPFAFDAATLAAPIDAFISNEVLEHIPADVLPGLLKQAFAVMAPGALAVHSIDYSDHYARGDAVTRHNFLVYSDAQWKPYNSRYQYVNRLRDSEYHKLFKDAGFEVIWSEPHRQPLSEQVRQNLAPQFRRFAAEDLETIRSKIIARRP